MPIDEFGHLIARLSSKLRSLTSRIFIPQSFIDKEDLYQECLIHLFER